MHWFVVTKMFILTIFVNFFQVIYFCHEFAANFFTLESFQLITDTEIYLGSIGLPSCDLS